MRIGAALALGIGLALMTACDDVAVERADGTRGPTVAERNCVTALVRQTDSKRGEVAILRSQSVPEGDIVYLRIGEAERPWRCIADLDGTARSLLDLGAT